MKLGSLKNKLKKAFSGFVATLMIATSITVPSTTMKVNAAASFTTQNFYDALSYLTGVPSSTLSNPSYWSDYKYLDYPTYGAGAGGDMTLMTTGTSEQLRYGMLDCLRFAWAVTGHAMKNAGLNPTSYLLSNWYPSAKNYSNIVGFEITTDISKAEPGDLIEYGPQAHMGVVLGSSGGQLWTIDGSSPGHGPAIRAYNGYGSSGGQGGAFYRLYHFPHTPPTKTIQLSVAKTSANKDVTDGNSSYSLAGAKFEVHEGENTSGKLLATLTTNASGTASTSLEVDYSTSRVTFVEVSAPTGYRLDSKPQTVAIDGSNKATASFSDSPVLTDLTVQLNKYSTNTNYTNANSAYSLQNAEYEVFYENQYGTYVSLGTVKTDANGFLSKTYNNLPLGIKKAQVVEKTAPKGYTLDNGAKQVDVSGNTATFSVGESPIVQDIKVEINKSSANPDITNGNSCYSLAGAVYEVLYQNQYGQYVSLGTLTTDENGKASQTYSGLPLGIGKTKIREITASKGYFRDTQEHEANLSDGKSTFNVQEVPGNDPLTIQIQKQSEDPIENPASLAGAEFTVKYYDVDPSGSYTTDQLAGMTAKRTWVLATKYRADINKYRTVLSDDYKVSGDEFYRTTDGKTACIPVGVITVQETKAPPGYTLENSVSYVLNDETKEYEETDGISIFKVTLDSDVSASIITKNNYLYTEGVSRGGLKIQKHDTANGLNPQGNATNLQAYYKIRNLNDYEVAMKVNGNIVATAQPNELFDYTIVTDTNGYWETSKNEKGKYEFLQAGTTDAPAKYRVEEITSPDGYVIEADENDAEATSFDFTLTDNQQVADVTSQLGDDIARGGFKLYKNDLDFEAPVAQGDTNLTTTFKIINRSINDVVVAGKTYHPGETIELNGDGNKYFTTDENGYFEIGDQFLPFGTYEIDEVQAPTGYKLEGTLTTTFTITEDHQIVDLSKAIYDAPVEGTFSIYKHYNKQNGSEWDDAPEKNAVFLGILTRKLNSTFNGDIFDAYEKIVDIIGSDLKVDGDVKTAGTEANILYTTYGLSPKEFTILKTNAKGKATSTPLVYGTYTIHQITGDPEAIINDDAATFVVSGTDSKTTDSDGMEVAVKNDQEQIDYSATNDYKTYQISIVKKDAETGKKVTLNGASFKIGYDSDGDGKWTEADRAYNKVFSDYNQIKNGFVVQTVSGKEYDTFRTYTGSDYQYDDGTFVVSVDSDDQKGSVTTPVKVRAGRYFIFEKDNDDATFDETPWGYVTADPDEYDINGSLYNKSDNNAQYPVATEVQLTETHYAVMYDRNTQTKFGDDLYTVTTVIKDKRALGQLNLHKTIEAYADADKSLINRTDLSGFGFELRAAEDIIDPADGSVITKKGELAKVLENGAYVEAGRFNANADGTYVLNNIPLGNYKLTEVEQPAGTVTNDATYDVSFTQPDNDRTTEVYPFNQDIENKTTKVEFTKKSLTGDEELAGATLKVVDVEHGYTIDEWVGSDKPHIIEGLTAGKKYRLEEEAAPEGYVIANAIEFTVADTSDLQTVKMIDKIVTVAKIDANGNPVVGAEMQVLDANGNVMDSWTTDGTGHRVCNLREDGSYTIVEVKAPNGYVKATDISFTATGKDENGQKADQVFTVRDKKVVFSKIDATGNFVSGATIEAYELNSDGNIVTNEDGTNKVVDRWVSGEGTYDISNFEAGKSYVLREVESPDGYVTASDVIITVEDTGKDQSVSMIDMVVEVFKKNVKIEALEGAKMQILDEEGNVVDEWTSTKEARKARHLIAGHNYILREVEAPEGYVKAADIYFTVEDNGENHVEVMYDKQVKITKVDAEGNPVVGAELTVTDTQGNVIDSWTTDGNGHYVGGQTVGQDYIVSETGTPKNYVKADSITYRVEDDGKDQEFNLVDKQVTVTKTDADGKPVSGAEFEVLDPEGKVVDSWTTDEDTHYIENLREGVEYTIHEAKAPNGYVTATDVKFTVTGADDEGMKENQSFTVADKKVTVSKIDMGGKEVEGAEMTVTDEEGNVIDKWTSDGSKHEVENLEENKKYILKEVVAPKGYVKATDIPFTVTGEDENGVKVDQHIDMTDKKVTLDKTAGNGKEVPGAKITITDEDGNEVDKWTSTDKPHEIEKLEAGKKYKWHEDYSEDLFGYYYAEDYEFTVTDDGIDQALEMVDKPIKYQISKIDDKGKAVKGVTLELSDITTDEEGKYVNADKDGNPAKIELPNGGVTTGKPFELVNKLEAGHTYALEETEIVAGVYKTGRVEFTVSKYNPSTNDFVIVEMVDSTTAVRVRKVDENGNAVVGAKLQILETTTDEEGNDKVVYEFESSDDPTGDDISDKVKGGETYILRETEAPFGFEKSEDITFKVNGENGVYQIINMTDTHRDEYVTVVKVDSKNNKKKLAGATFEIRSAKDDKVVASGTTGKDGTLSFKVTWADDDKGYYAVETKAPKNYKKSDEKYVIEKATDKVGFDEKSPVTLTVKNEKIPNTGVTGPIAAGGLMAAGLGGLAVSLSKKKKKHEKK